MVVVATDSATAAAVLRLSSQLVAGIQDGLRRRGFDNVRPVHGFAFAFVSAGGATTSGLAAHLGVTKQAAAQLVDYLVERGYLRREPDPRDGRARLLALTDHGHACTRAADDAAADVVRQWRSALTVDQATALEQTLHLIAPSGPLRPAW